MPKRPGTLKRLVREPIAAVALAIVVLLVLAALLAPWLSPTGPYDNDLGVSLTPPAHLA